MRSWWNLVFGDAGERAAARHLRRLGFRIVARQCRNRFGEIDLIALEGEWLVFVEVKTRRDEGAGQPMEAVTLEKQRRLTRTVRAFLKERRLERFRSRFDVVGVTWVPGEKTPRITHAKHAFQPTD